MDLESEIAQIINAIAPDQRARVLQFAASPPSPVSHGESGVNLRSFARSLDSDSAQQMMRAIDEGCEQAVAGGYR
jgi:hypothetical protein